MRYSKARSIANARGACKAKTSCFFCGSIHPHHNILCLHPNPTPISAILLTTPVSPFPPPSHALPDTPHHQPPTFLVVFPNSNHDISRRYHRSPQTSLSRHTNISSYTPQEIAHRTSLRYRPSGPVETTGPRHRPPARSAPDTLSAGSRITNRHEPVGFHSPRSRPSSSTRTARVG